MVCADIGFRSTLLCVRCCQNSQTSQLGGPYWRKLQRLQVRFLTPARSGSCSTCVRAGRTFIVHTSELPSTCCIRIATAGVTLQSYCRQGLQHSCPAPSRNIHGITCYGLWHNLLSTVSCSCTACRVVLRRHVTVQGRHKHKEQARCVGEQHAYVGMQAL